MNVTTKNSARLPGVALLITLIGLSMIGFNAHAASTTGGSVPQSLVDVGEYSENLYDYAKAKDWKHADATLKSLLQAAKKMHTDVVDQAAAADRADQAVATLGRAVAAKDFQATMREANEVTRDTADMTAAYSATAPVAVARLDYYGRELEIWAQAQNLGKLRATTVAMRHEWNTLRPVLTSRAAAEATKFESLVAQVEATKAPAEYTRLAGLVLDEVDSLEKVFHG
jgi:hypothetical protein